MKKIKKALTLTLAALLVTALLPLNAFAADVPADATAVMIKGIPVSSLTAATMYGTIDAAKANTIELQLSPADLNNAANVVVVTETVGDSSITLIGAGNTDTVNAPGDINTAVAAAGNAALVPGSYIWIRDGDGSGYKYARIQINQKSDGSFGGDSTVKIPIYNVVVPTNVNFAIDPLQLGNVTDDSQITTANYKVINKSDVDVRVTFDLTATLGSGVKFVEKNALDQVTTTGAPKDVYFAALSAEGVTPNSLNYASALTDMTATFAYDADPPKGTLVPFGVSLGAPGNEKTTLAFLLGKSTGTPLDTLAAANEGVASFQFYANLNTYADWKANDIQVVGSYNLQGIKGSDYKTQAALPANYVTGSLNQVPLTPNFIGAATATTTIAGGADIEVPFFAAGKSLASATLLEYAIDITGDTDISGGKIVIDRTNTGSSMYTLFAGTFTIRVNLAGDSTNYDFVLTVS
jgi:hypothetical protein